MYQVKPLGLNTKQSDRDVADGSLQESINMQWREGAFRPIPNRLTYNTGGGVAINDIIYHKIGDENIINELVLFSTGIVSWRGVITDGIYAAKSPAVTITDLPTITDDAAISYTVLNGLIYIMSRTQNFYYRLQFDESNQTYVANNMYAWKDLIGYYPNHVFNFKYNVTSGSILYTSCGFISLRYTLVLKTGEEVLPSPIFEVPINAINHKSSPVLEGELLTNIHAFASTYIEFLDNTTFDNEVVAINFYASIPYYITKVILTQTIQLEAQYVDVEILKEEMGSRVVEPFYLVKTIVKSGADATKRAILFYTGTLDAAFDPFPNEVSYINLDTIAAGMIMPVDDFTYHKIFGTITSDNGRLVISKPRTVLFNGYNRSLSAGQNATLQGFKMNTEDGIITSSSTTGKNIIYNSGYVLAGSIISYPDKRATHIGVADNLSATNLLFVKLKANSAHNISYISTFASVGNRIFAPTWAPGDAYVALISYAKINLEYPVTIETVSNPTFGANKYYTSENRLQYSAPGEFSVFPALNSYRIGEGVIMFVGNNSIDPSVAKNIAPLLIGTSDGVYTVNYDPSGLNLIQSITMAANLPAISKERIQIDQNLIYISDKGFIVINNGEPVNITNDHFPEQGTGNFGTQNTIYPNYTALTAPFPNTYALIDIVTYLKGSIFAYDGRRNNIWCSNSSKNYSLVYNLNTQQWGASTYVFDKVFELFSSLSTSQGLMYSRNLVRHHISQFDSDIDILSGENPTSEVFVHILTRPIKLNNPDEYKKILRMMVRCELYRTNGGVGYFSFGLWGKQDLNQLKQNFALAAFLDGSTTAWPNDIRQDIPVGRRTGKYKTMTILITGKIKPNSIIDGVDIDVIPVDNNIMR
jgi:hypothetical protein